MTDDSTLAHKMCSKCGELKDLEAFLPRKASRDGRRGTCRECDYAARRRQYADSDQKERYRDRRSAYYQENRPRLLVEGAARREASREYHRENSRRWRERNPDHASALNRESSILRRVREGQQDCGCVTVLDIMFLLTLPCTYCGDAAEHIDHIHPLSRGGLHCLSNLTPACASCNLAKSATVLDDPPPAVLNCPKNSSD